MNLCNSETSGITVSYYPQRWACSSDGMKYGVWWGSYESAVVVFYCSNMFSPCVDVALKEIVSHTPLPGLQVCPDFCSALMSLLWLKCKAKQPTLLYISQPVPADMCSLKHFWARDTSLVCSVLLEEKKKKRKKERKNVSYFFFSFTMAESNILWHLNREPCITALAARCLDRITHVKQEEK